MIDNTVFDEGYTTYKEQSFAEQGWYITNMLKYIFSDTGLIYELFLIIRVAEGQWDEIVTGFFFFLSTISDSDLFFINLLLLK